MKPQPKVRISVLIHTLAWGLALFGGIRMFVHRSHLEALRKQRREAAADVVSGFQIPLLTTHMLLTLTNNLEAEGVAVTKCERLGGVFGSVESDSGLDVIWHALLETPVEPEKVSALLPEAGAKLFSNLTTQVVVTGSEKTPQGYRLNLDLIFTMPARFIDEGDTDPKELSW